MNYLWFTIFFFSCKGLVLYQLCQINVSILKVAEAGSKSLGESVKISILVEYQVYELMAVLEGRGRRCESEGTPGKMVVQYACIPLGQEPLQQKQ